MPGSDKDDPPDPEWRVDQIDDLPRVLDGLEAHLVAHAWDDTRRRRALVISEELLVNALTHGRGQGATAPAYLAVTAELALSVRHAAPSFDPCAASIGPSNPYEFGGNGLRLVREYARTLTWVHVDGENVTTVTL